jgi:hypothetical protein
LTCPGDAWERCRSIPLQRARWPDPSAVDRPASSPRPRRRRRPRACREHRLATSLWSWRPRDGLGTPRMSGTPAPWVRALIAGGDAARRAPHPPHGRSAIPHAGLACGGTAVLVTHALGWARVARTRLGTTSLAAVSWMCRPRQRPGDARVVARGGVMLPHEGLPGGHRRLDDPDPTRATAATTLAPLDTRRAHDRGGSGGGPSRVLRGVVTPRSPSRLAVPSRRPPPSGAPGIRRTRA